MAPAQTKPLSQPTFFLMAAPWDLPGADRGIGDNPLSTLLDRLRGEVGLTGLSLWAAAPPSRRFRTRESSPRLLHSEGGLFFAPVQSRGGCRPPTTDPTSRQFLAEVATTCKRHDLALRLLFSTATIGGLAQYYPEFASRSAFDDASRKSVCLLNAAVQECITNITCGTPPQFSVGQIVLHDVQPGWLEAFDGEIRWPAPLGIVEETMLATCFCPSCFSAAKECGVDGDGARLAVRNLLQRSFTNGTTFRGTIAGFLAEQPSLAAYRDMQDGLVNAFLTKLVAECDKEILIARGSPTAGGNTERFDHHIPAGIITSVVSVADAPSRLVPEARRNELNFPGASLLGPHAEEFVAAMSGLGEWGCSGVQIDDYGALPDSSFSTLKQAIRFARRSVTL